MTFARNEDPNLPAEAGTTYRLVFPDGMAIFVPVVFIPLEGLDF